MRIGRIWFGSRKRSSRYKPVIHLIMVDDRDNPIGKTFCGKVADDWHKNHVLYENSTEKPTCKKCIQNQRKNSKLTMQDEK